MRMEGYRASIGGYLVEIPVGMKKGTTLDGFFVPGDRRRPAVIIVHGMHSNFYRARWKKELMRMFARRGIAVFSFNNRGYEEATNDERFHDCLTDIAAAVRFAKGAGYHRVVLVGHSTGCQKTTYYQAVRQDSAVCGVALLALGDDLAIVRRDLGRTYRQWLTIARARIKRGRGHEPLGAPHIPPFSVRRFLSIADPRAVEARVFDFTDGPGPWFARILCPVLCIAAERDEYQTVPTAQMISSLKQCYRGTRFQARVVRGTDHGFHGRETALARVLFRWVQSLGRATA